MKDLFSLKLKLLRDKPRYFYLNTCRVVSGVLFWLATLLPFYFANINKYNIFVLKVSYIFFIGLFIIPITIGIYTLKEDKKSLDLIVKSTAIVQALFIVLMYLEYLSAEASDLLLNIYRLDIGFYVLALLSVIILLLSFLPNFVIKIIVKVFKIKKKDVIDAEVIDIEK